MLKIKKKKWVNHTYLLVDDRQNHQFVNNLNFFNVGISDKNYNVKSVLPSLWAKIKFCNKNYFKTLNHVLEIIIVMFLLWTIETLSTLSHFEFFVFVAPGSLMSLIAGLFFGGISAYGAFRISIDPQDKWTSFGECPTVLMLKAYFFLSQFWISPFHHFSFL